ncbi:heme exporter protein CcmD [Polaromonas jejuensis]|uniref:Heme exporter protein D n=1 Tax=Polaromonas jejuensis TaxID=457502 RepID=A0ABW0Q5M9_9BURK|nr:heme exporter protein CcmD [Polaromonas jejuensis]
MNWNSVGEFLALGGYGLYVWGAYAMVLVLMVCEPLLALRRHRRALGDTGGSHPEGRVT